jgi:uncharacterized protein
VSVFFPDAPLDMIVGDLTAGRPNLGPFVRLELYRTLLYSVKKSLEDHFGEEKAREFLNQTGNRAGQAFYRHIIGDVADLDEFTATVKTTFKNMLIGNVEFDSIDLDSGKLVITVAEDVDCSGLPNQGKEVCVFSEGLISGLLEAFTGKPFSVREASCWASGDDKCRFICQRRD